MTSLNAQNSDINLNDIWCVVPVYNNATTLVDVVKACRKYVQHVLVIDDGSTDAAVSNLLSGIDVQLLRHPKNRGKGAALTTALDYVHSKGGRFMITVDADGQHYPDDIPLFLNVLDEHCIYIGARDFDTENVPKKSKFGRKFSNFWYRIETGLNVADTQSGFRVYPVALLKQIVMATRCYDWEVEVLVRAAWAGINVKTIPIKVYYPPSSRRISHFHPLRDNVKLSLLHMRLLGRVLMPMPHKRLVFQKLETDFDIRLFKSPRLFFEKLLNEHATPTGLAAASFVSIFLAVLPLLSVHMLVILYVVSRLHLNKVMALGIQNICIPPFVPVLCIEIGHYLLYKEWITEVSLNVIFWQIKDRVWEWFIGSLVVAPVLAAIVAVIVFIVSEHCYQQRCRHER